MYQCSILNLLDMVSINPTGIFVVVVVGGRGGKAVTSHKTICCLNQEYMGYHFCQV